MHKNTLTITTLVQVGMLALTAASGLIGASARAQAWPSVVIVSMFLCMLISLGGADGR